MLIGAIKNLEKSNVILVNSINPIESTIVKLQQKNQGLTILKNVAKILKRNNEIQLVDNFSTTMVTDLQYPPVTSVDVERSFRTYKIF